MQIIKEIGIGAFGKVYEVVVDGERRAAKTCLPRRNEATINKETALLKRVNHKNIVTAFGIQLHEDDSYLIMEYMEGGSMKDLLDSKHFTLTDVLHWFSQVADGLAYLHGMRPKPMLHRDIKPHNILLSRDLQIAKIGDFGLSRDLSNTMSDNIGSAPYMAPEVFESGRYTEKCDVYSFAITLWQMWARKQPFAEYDTSEMIKMAAHMGKRPSFEGLCGHRKLTNLISDCWHKDPLARPAMEIVVMDLRNTLTLYKQFEMPPDLLADNVVHEVRVLSAEHQVRDFVLNMQRRNTNMEMDTNISNALDTSILQWAGNRPLIGIVDDSKYNGQIPEDQWTCVEAAVAGVALELLYEYPGTTPSCPSIGWLRNSIRLMLCEDERSLELYKMAIAKIDQVYPGAKLRVIDAKDLRLGPEATAMLPKKPAEPKSILEMMSIWNPLVPTKNWKVLDIKECAHSQIQVIFRIDNDTVEHLRKCNGIVNYGFKTVRLSVTQLYTKLSELSLEFKPLLSSAHLYNVRPHSELIEHPRYLYEELPHFDETSTLLHRVLLKNCVLCLACCFGGARYRPIE